MGFQCYTLKLVIKLWQVPTRIGEFRAQEISNLLIAYARFNHLNPVMLEVRPRC